MLCSSIVGPAVALELGPVTYTSSVGAIVRKDVRFPFAPQQTFLVVQFGHFAGILHSQLAIDTAKSGPDVSLAVMSFDYPAPISMRGKIDPAWRERLGSAREVVFEEGNYIVAVVRSPYYRAAGIAAVPLHYLEGRSHDVALRLVPAGILAGIALF